MGIVKKEAGKRRSPIFHYANQCSVGKMWRCPLVGHEGKPGAVERDELDGNIGESHGGE
jgi:hypothetical protein